MGGSNGARPWRQMNTGGRECLAKTKNRDFGPDKHQSVETTKMAEETDIDLP